MADDHIKYAWAAYRRGAFKQAEDYFPDGLDRDSFLVRFVEMANEAMANGIEVWTVFGKTSYGIIPIALLTIQFSRYPVGRLAQPHVVWYPEASPRNKIEAGVLMLRELKKESMILIASADDVLPYHRHLAKYGLLRSVGKLRDYRGEGQHAMLFQSVGH